MAKRNRGSNFRGIAQAPIIGQVSANERAIEDLRQQVTYLHNEMKNLNDSLVNAQLTLATLRRCLKHGWWRRLLFGLWNKRWITMGKAMIQETKEAIKKQEEEAKKAQNLKTKEEEFNGNPERKAQ